ncbi:hypothetical protein [Acinetobacter sp. YH12063]|uniref:hypothetical protein n=1 Tax=Acinetobacter sp. YH12063 TaxID=2601061 RepID=UPI0015D3D097|nr:hypothetical protein [Acinetobacter sp. YH12063]
MVNFLIVMCILIALSAAGIVVKKIIKTEKYRQKYTRYQAQKKSNSISLASNDDAIRQVDQVIEVDEYEQQLFDDIAEIFFQQQYKLDSLQAAEQLQEVFLRRMPVNCKTQIRQLDLNEWSIYWSFYNQSLEYYLGRYGEFYTHVDRFGEEHKIEYRYQYSAS